MNKFTGIYAASLTPMRADYSCDHEELAAHCQDLIRRGCKGVVLFGTTGEGTSFSVGERQEALHAVIKLGVDPQQIMMSVSYCSIADTVQLARIAVEARCAGILLIPPFFYKKGITEEGVITFYREVIRKVNNPNLRVLLYHIPQYSGVPITLNIIKALTEEFPTIVVGIKESEGNFALVKEVISNFPNFKVLVGKESMISEAVRAGAAGSICGMANLYPELICSLYAYGKDSRQPNRNEEIKKISEQVSRYSLFPAIKALLENKKGSRWHIMRPPFMPLSEKERKELIT